MHSFQWLVATTNLLNPKQKKCPASHRPMNRVSSVVLSIRKTVKYNVKWDTKIKAIPLQIFNNNIQDIFTKYLSGDVVGLNVENQDVEVLLSSLPCPLSSVNEPSTRNYETANNEIQELRKQTNFMKKNHMPK